MLPPITYAIFFRRGFWYYLCNIFPPRVLHFSITYAIFFRRGFCTLVLFIYKKVWAHNTNSYTCNSLNEAVSLLTTVPPFPTVSFGPCEASSRACQPATCSRVRIRNISPHGMRVEKTEIHGMRGV